MDGLIIIERIDGTKRFEERSTRDHAVDTLSQMEKCYPNHYTITGERTLDGAINLQFKAVTGLLNSLTFRFIPDPKN